MKKNVLLTIASLSLILVLAMLLDRVAGGLLEAPELPGRMALIFPPEARQTYKTTDFSYAVQINSLGLREREIPPRTEVPYRMLAIGDSFTYGWGVNAEDTWLRRLETLLDDQGHDLFTINCGKPGAGPEWYSEIAETVVPLLQPELVLVVLTISNDLIGVGSEMPKAAGSIVSETVEAFFPNIVALVRQGQTPPMESMTQEMPPQVTTAENNQRWYANTARSILDKLDQDQRAQYDDLESSVRNAFEQGMLNPFLVDLAFANPDYYDTALNSNDNYIRECVQRLAARLTHIHDIAQSNGARLVVLTLPDGPYANVAAHKRIKRVGYTPDDETLTSLAPEDAIIRACDEAKVTSVRTLGDFRSYRDDSGMYFELDGHLTTDGHARFAELVAEKLAPYVDGLPGTAP